jgi:hypothetical protein
MEVFDSIRQLSGPGERMSGPGLLLIATLYVVNCLIVSIFIVSLSSQSQRLFCTRSESVFCQRSLTSYISTGTDVSLGSGEE